MIDLRNLTLDETTELVLSLKEPKFRAKQIYEWVHKKQASLIDDFTNISKPLREKLKECSYISKCEITKKLDSKKDNVSKYIVTFDDNSAAECVLMNFNYGLTLCISSQIGCRMGCSFCASGIDGLFRNLTAGEMLGQIYAITKDIESRIGNIVLMGSGEPLDNYVNVLKFIKLVNAKEGYELGQRHITLSTCGLVHKINELADENLAINLAVSLHAPNGEIRKEIMPVAKKYDYHELLDSCRYYANITKRRITFEYALIDGVNDTPMHARELIENIKGILCHVNLIPANEIKERSYKKTSPENAEKFLAVLTSYGIPATIRKSLGNDIEGACGQLRRRYANEL